MIKRIKYKPHKEENESGLMANEKEKSEEDKPTDNYVRKRIEGEYKFQTEKLRNLFRIIYRDETLAWETWQKRVKSHGFDATQKLIQTKPSYYGKLRGKHIYGFLKTQEYQDRERANKDLKYTAEKWYASALQLEQTEKRIECPSSKQMGLV